MPNTLVRGADKALIFGHTQTCRNRSQKQMFSIRRSGQGKPTDSLVLASRGTPQVTPGSRLETILAALCEAALGLWCQFEPCALPREARKTSRAYANRCTMLSAGEPNGRGGRILGYN
jgi:hypothetical protein